MKREQLYRNDEALSHRIKHQFNLADAVSRISQSLVDRNTQMLELHNHELVSHPEETILKLCQFLEIECSSDYVRACASKVFPELSRTRFVGCTGLKEPRKQCKITFRNIHSFKGYSYDSEI